MTGFILYSLRKTLADRNQANEELKKALEQLESSTREVRKLQEGLQVVCAWTKQIKVGDKWMTPDEFMSSQLHMKISHGMSPEAVREFEQDIARKAEEGSRKRPA
jgi:translation initiation factor 2B subunit (eIF-2B alpha/beta/delta family)